MEELDWNELWKELMQKSSWSRRRRGGDMTDFWNKRAKHYSESIKRHNHAERIIAKLDIDPECTILDIGAGPGTLAIPLAKMVKHVTAVDPSSGMLACLNENAVSEGLKKGSNEKNTSSLEEKTCPSHGAKHLFYGGAGAKKKEKEKEVIWKKNV